MDLNAAQHVVLDRAAQFPDYIAANEIYAFDPTPKAEIAQHKKRAKVQAAILGDDNVDEAESTLWRYSDPRLDNFAEVVPPEIVDDDERFKALGDSALVARDDGSTSQAQVLVATSPHNHERAGVQPALAGGSCRLACPRADGRPCPQQLWPTRSLSQTPRAKGAGRLPRARDSSLGRECAAVGR